MKEIKPKGTVVKGATSKAPKSPRKPYDVDKANKAFAKLTDAQKRVAIAKDALLWLESSPVKIQGGSYLTFSRKSVPDSASGKDYDARTLIEQGESCSCCAMGMLLYAHIRRLDQVSVYVGPGDACGFGDSTVKSAANYFPIEHLRLIECAFEGFFVHKEAGLDIPKGLKSYGRQWNAAFPRQKRKRLAAILKNIIRNKGDFNIADVPKSVGTKGLK